MPPALPLIEGHNPSSRNTGKHLHDVLPCNELSQNLVAYKDKDHVTVSWPLWIGDLRAGQSGGGSQGLTGAGGSTSHVAAARGWGVGASQRGCFRRDEQTGHGGHVPSPPCVHVGAASCRAGCQVSGIPGGPLGSGYHKNWQRLLQKVFMEREKGNYQCLMPKPSLRSFLLFTAPDPTGRPLFIMHFHSQKQVKRPGGKSSDVPRAPPPRPWLGKCRRGCVCRMGLPGAGLGWWPILAGSAALWACPQVRCIPGPGVGGRR